MEIIALS
jgi:hypothetical protein